MEAEEHRRAGDRAHHRRRERHLEAPRRLPDSPEVRDLREKGLGYINEAVLWKDAKPRPTVQMREALMKKVLALHVEASKLGGGGPPDSPSG
jgi:hypothetical protein